MSSTNRWYDRHKSDYYVTPKRPVEYFLWKFLQDENKTTQQINNYDVLDPCAWWDEKHDMTYPHWLFYRWFDYNKIDTVDIREDSGAYYKWDFLEMEFEKDYDFIISNPPFHLAQEFVEKSLDLCKEWWYVIMLLRLNFVWWKKREQFWENNLPYAIYAHNKRMWFTDWGWTDSIEYWHFVWKKWENNEFSKFKILFS